MIVLRYRALFCALATSVTLLAPGAFAAPPTAPAPVASPSPAEEPGPKDAQALKALKKALEEDFLETRFDDAVQRLRAAVKTCGSEGCSHHVLARLHAALGSILAGGKRELEDGRDAFIDALMLDPTIKPDPEISSAAVTFSFEQAQRRLTAINNAEKSAASSAAPVKPPAPRRPPPPPPKPPHARENWVSFTVVPDFTLLSGNNICSPDSRRLQGYTCLLTDANKAPGVKYTSTPTANAVGQSTYGDNVNLGFSPATLRVLIGYERLLFKQLTIGLRFGMAFDPKGSSNVDFVPFHGEARVAYFPRPSSFLGTVVRPYLSIAGGLEQVNTRIDGVEVLEDGKACGAMDPDDVNSPCAKGPATGGRKLKLFAYKRAGLGFVSGGAGLQIAPVDNFSINFGVRGGVTFPIIIGVISPEIGASIGF